jgi:hypothetical protein
MSVNEAADFTVTCPGPSWVLSSKSAVFAAVSFSNVTVADLVALESLDVGVTDKLAILPLGNLLDDGINGDYSLSYTRN